MTEIDRKIAQYYAPIILQGVKRGESSVCVWFPGSGKFTIAQNILQSAKILKSVLGGLHSRLKIAPFLGIETSQATTEEILSYILRSLGGEPRDDSLRAILERINDLIESGQEVLLVGNWLEKLSETEYEKLLISLAKIVLINKARVHCLLLLHNKPLFEKFIFENPDCACLAQTFNYIPILSGKVLEKFVFQQEKIFGSLSPTRRKEIISSTGGILSLTRELIRNKGDSSSADLKFRANWQDVSVSYQRAILASVKKEKPANYLESQATKELGLLGVVPPLTIFREKYSLLVQNPEELLLAILSAAESRLWLWLKKNRGKLLSRDQIAKVWQDGNQIDGYSDWQIDQAISRFRKKLRQCGFGDAALITIKGRGYRWLLPD